jgi:hypothetical protein
MTDNVGDFTHAFLDNVAMEEARAYMERGRRFREMPIEELNQAWADAFDLVCGLGERTRIEDLSDLGAELSLRGLEKPAHLVQDAMKRAQARVAGFPDNPAGLNALRDDIGRFLAEMKKPKN